MTDSGASGPGVGAARTVGTKQAPGARGAHRTLRPPSAKPWRQATVRVTDLSDGRSFCRSAASVAAEWGAFDYSDGIRSVDHLWDPVERALVPAIDWVREAIRPTAQTL